jgi:hypothetical protein
VPSTEVPITAAPAPPPSGVSTTLSLVLLPWHVVVAGANFPQLLADARLAALLNAALAEDVAALLALASADWVQVQMMSSTAATRRVTTAALSADLVVQVPGADVAAAAVTMAATVIVSVSDDWLNKTFAVYANVVPQRAVAEPVADSIAAESTSGNAAGTCGSTCIVVVALIAVVIVGVVSATIVVVVDQKKKVRDLKADAGDHEMRGGGGADDNDDDEDDEFDGDMMPRHDGSDGATSDDGFGGIAPNPFVAPAGGNFEAVLQARSAANFTGAELTADGMNIEDVEDVMSVPSDDGGLSLAPAVGPVSRVVSPSSLQGAVASVLSFSLTRRARRTSGASAGSRTSAAHRSPGGGVTPSRAAKDLGDSNLSLQDA